MNASPHGRSLGRAPQLHGFAHRQCGGVGREKPLRGDGVGKGRRRGFGGPEQLL